MKAHPDFPILRVACALAACGVVSTALTVGGDAAAIRSEAAAFDPLLAEAGGACGLARRASPQC